MPVASCLLLTGLLSLVTGCASWRQPRYRYDERLTTVDSETAQAAAVQAARVRVEASLDREQEGGWVDRLELRLNRIGTDDGSLDEDLELSTRLFFTSPAEEHAQQAVFQAETELAVTELEVAALEEMAQSCDRSIDASAALEIEDQYRHFAQRVEEVKAWTEALAAEGFTDQLESTETLLLADLELLTAQPPPAPPSPDRRFALPSLSPPPHPLSIEEATVGPLVRRYNPSMAGRTAAAERYAALARRERNRRYPSLDFLELSYHLLADTEWDALSAQISIEIPLPGHTSQDRYHQLSEAEHLDASALEEELVWIVREALADIALFEQRAPGWSRLLALAGQAESIADQWLTDRRGEPNDILNLVRRAFAARVALIERQREVGQAACTVLSSSGVPLEAWPRHPNP